MSMPFVGCCAPSGWRCGTLGAMRAGSLYPTPAPKDLSLEALVLALHAQTAAIESLVAINAALLERLPLPDADEPDVADEAWPAPLSRPR